MQHTRQTISLSNVPNLTIGIPAYNEEQNIINLLESLLKQTTNNFHLKKIIVISDGSTDTTEEKVRTFSITHPRVQLIADGKRKGKSARLEELYHVNTSDYLLLLDADCRFENLNACELLVQQFQNEHIVFASSHKIPVVPDTTIGRVFYWWHELFSNVYETYNNRQNIYNITSSGYLVRKTFVQTIKHEKHIISEGLFLYFLALQQKKQAVFVTDAILLTRLPETMKEYISLTQRTHQQKNYLVAYFGSWILPYYTIPRWYTRRRLFLFVLRHPIKSFVTILFHLALFHLPAAEDPNLQKGIWTTLTTSKKAV